MFTKSKDKCMYRQSEKHHLQAYIERLELADRRKKWLFSFRFFFLKVTKDRIRLDHMFFVKNQWVFLF